MQRIIGWLHAAYRNIIKKKSIPSKKFHLSQNDVEIQYYLADPTRPELLVSVTMPDTPKGAEFKIKGYTPGSEVKTGTSGWRSAVCNATISETLDFVQKNIRYPISKWAATSVLVVDPEAGKRLNAFYDRSGLRFFYDNHPKTGKMVYCAESSHVVSHELGHAVLDAIRPDLWNVHALEIWGFHEAFGDCLSILHLMQYDDALQFAINETGGNFHQSNLLSRIAPELGGALHHQNHGKDGSVEICLRDAVNRFNYVQPEKLPSRSRVDELSAEPHNFSRVFLGAWYDLLISIYEHETRNNDKMTALKKARDVAGVYLFEAIRIAPAIPKFYRAVYEAMEAVDKASGGEWWKVLNRAFGRRKIVPLDIPFMSKHYAITYKDVVTNLKKEDEVLKLGEVTAVRTKNTKTVNTPPRRGMVNDENPLYGLMVDVPADSYYEFDENGRLLKKIMPDDDEILESAYCCLDLMHNLNYVNDNHDAPFKIQDGKLIRSYFSCGADNIASDNANNPQAPEYGKKWKPENNCGCPPCGKPKITPAAQKVKQGCVVRYNTCRVASLKAGSSTSLKTC